MGKSTNRKLPSTRRASLRHPEGQSHSRPSSLAGNTRRASLRHPEKGQSQRRPSSLAGSIQGHTCRRTGSLTDKQGLSSRESQPPRRRNLLGLARTTSQRRAPQGLPQTGRHHTARSEDEEEQESEEWAWASADHSGQRGRPATPTLESLGTFGWHGAARSCGEVAADAREQSHSDATIPP